MIVTQTELKLIKKIISREMSRHPYWTQVTTHKELKDSLSGKSKLLLVGQTGCKIRRKELKLSKTILRQSPDTTKNYASIELREL